MRKNKKKQPELRFPEFTDDWEQRKLANVGVFSKGRGYSKGDLIDAGTPIILYGRLYTKYETAINDVDTFVELKEGSVFSNGGEVIIPASGETSEDIARAATVGNKGVLLGGDLNIITPNEDINSEFLALSISNGNPHRELAKKAQGKSVVHIHNEEIKNLMVPFPKKNEQEKIAKSFSKLDNLITLHQRKLEKLKEMKKGVMQKLFSQEVRFKADDGSEFPDWEEKKFSDVYSSFPNKEFQLQTKEYKEIGRYVIVDQGKELIAGYSNDANKVCYNVPCIVFGDHTTVVKFVNKPFIVGADGVKTLKSRYNDKFAFYNLCHNNVKPTGYNRHFSKLKELSFYIPSCLAEQQKIADCLSSLDDIIEKQEATLAAWKEMKKGLLQKMFV